MIHNYIYFVDVLLVDFLEFIVEFCTWIDDGVAYRYPLGQVFVDIFTRFPILFVCG